MKKFLLLIIFAFAALPVCAFNLDPKGYFNSGEFVNIEIISPESGIVMGDYVDYMLGLGASMEDNWNPPLHAKSSKTVYTFEIQPDKEIISHINLLRTSGYKDVDRSAMSLLKKEIVFKNFPDNVSQQKLVLKATFVRSVLGRSDVINNGAVVILTKNSKKEMIKNTDKVLQKIYCRNYIRRATRHLKKNFTLSDQPAIFLSVFKFDILRDGTVSNIKVTATSGDRNFNNDVISRLANTRFEPFSRRFLADKVTLEYKISNQLKKPSKK